MKLSFTIVLFVTLLISTSSQAQNNFSSEEELKEKATELFEEGKLVEAEPLYAQLLSLYSKDPEYNYRYGACLLAADGDKEKAMKYLKFAIAKPNSDPLAYYYLGRAHHLNYNFAQAVKYYSRFKNKSSNDEREKYQVERKIEMCKNGNDLLSRLNEVQVLEKQEISRKDFFRIYDLDGIDGKVITTPEDFLAKEDKKREGQYIMYLPPNAKEVYYASYGKKGENGKDIYKRVKLGNGNWSDAVSLGNSINTPYDEDYPFIHPDGRTIYFASKGHSSMGGYDLFMSTYDESIADWTAPTNLDFAFSSADDDVLFITDKDRVMAYFASNRTNEAGKITVYKVLVEKAPADLSVIKGKFIAENNQDMSSAKITVVDQATNQTIGVYETDKNGNYQIEITSNGGDYKFNLETTEDAPIHTGIVSIPKQEEFEVLGQELRLVGEGPQQRLVIKNIFDGTTAQNLNNAGPVVSSEVLRRKASLDVNVKEDRLADLLPSSTEEESATKPTNTALNEKGSAEKEASAISPSNQSQLKETSDGAGNATTSTPEALASLKAKVAQLVKSEEEQLANTEQASTYAYDQAQESKQEADKLFQQAEEQKQSGAPKDDWQNTLDYAQEAAAQAVFSAEIGEKLDLLAKQQEEGLKQTKSEATAIRSKVENNQLAEAELSYNKLDSRIKGSKETKDYNELLNAEKSAVKSQLQANSSKVSSFQQKEKALAAEMDQLSSQLKNLREAYNNSSGGKKKEISQGIDNLELDSADMNYQYKQAQKDYERALKQETALGLKLQQTEMVEGKLKNDVALSQAPLNTSDKRELIDNLQAFISESKLGDYDVSKTPSFAANTSNSQTQDERDTEASEPPSPTPNNTRANSRSNEDETSSSTTLASIQEEFESRLQTAAQNSDEDLKRASKLGVYDEWIETLESELVEREAALAQTTNENQRAALQSESEAIMTVLEEKRNKKAQLEGEFEGLPLANNSAIQADGETPNNASNEQATEASGLDSQSNSANSYQPNSDRRMATFTEGELPKSSANLSSVDENTVVDFPASAFNFEQSFNYGSPEVPPRLAEAKRAMAEAQDLAEQAEGAKQAAFNLGTVEERNKAFERANLLEEASKRKQVEAANQYADVNEKEYLQNAGFLRQANNFDIDFESSNLDIANLLAEEAEVYYNQASSIRAEVDQNSRLSKIEADLQKAYDYEMLALRKQGEALNLLDVVGTEYANKDAVSEQSNRSRRSDFVQTISDAEVLSVKNAELAKSRGDSLTAVVENLEAEANVLKAQADDLPIGNERDSLLAIYENLSEEAAQKRSKASVYYEREQQIKEGYAEADKPSFAANIVRPYETEISNSIDLDTVNVDEERAEQVMQSQAYLNYVNRAQERIRLQKEAAVAYQSAEDLQKEQLQLKKEAISLRQKAEASDEQVEKDRLIKSATVIEQEAQTKQNSLDSLNNLIKVKNYMIRQAESDMRSAIANLSQIEQAEIQKLALENVDAAPLALADATPSSSSSQQQTDNGELRSAEASRQEGIEGLLNDAQSASQIDTGENGEVDNGGSDLSNQEATTTDDNQSSELAERTDSQESARTSNQDNGNGQGNTAASNSQNRPSGNTSSTSNTERGSLQTIPSASAGEIDRKELNRLPRNVKKAIFLSLNQNESAYDVNNPIPIVSKNELPEGLIYKVQVGAFRNPIPQDLFKGFAPLLAEKGPNGITRYTAGIFLNEAQAVYARDEIRKIGYSDAFVVAFLNGERISISGARSAKPEQASGEIGDISAKAGNRIPSSTNSNAATESLPAQYKAPDVQSAKHVNTVEGLFYTVQVGVFSKPVPKGTFDLSQITVKPLAGGLSRYNSGIFRSARAAEQAKNQIVTTIADAFVTAYYQGKRISLAEAARIENQ
ncbi:MAG: hypothetical protein RIC95_06980 [Vicingaceae bacterium]